MRANMLDAYAKGRKVQPQSKHVNAKLTPRQVQEIRKLYAEGKMEQIPLAKKYGVSQRVICLITRRESYKDVP
jgi:DNA-binding XRE family transcriptional regulator